MTNESSESIRLQLAMAFGQGAGVMLATPEALAFLSSEHASLVQRAVRDWTDSRFAFVELVRVLGQLSAAYAANDSKWEIEVAHVKKALPAVLGPCPCLKARSA
jgi:hypothetical protein